MKAKLTLAVIAGILSLAPVSGLAHHAEVVYDTTKIIKLEGTITKLQWTNPHAMIHFEFKNEQGQIEEWIIELSSLGTLIRSGWTKDTFKPGSHIAIESHPHREGIRRVNFEKMTIDGKLIRDKTSER